MSRPRVLTWHVHGSYLFYLAQAGAELFLPYREGRPEGYGARGGTLPWPDHVHEVPAEEVADLGVDLVLFQSSRNWEIDQHEILSDAQRRGPRIYLEHDPPLGHPTDTRHCVGDDPSVLLVHVTPFNDLMWDPGLARTRVIDHGVTAPAGVEPTYELERALTVVNGLGARGRRLGPDVFERVRDAGVPVDLVGMKAEQMGGIGEIPHAELPAFSARYRCFFNPIRYTSLGLAVCEAMMLGLPVFGLATTEMSTAVRNGETGWVDTDIDALAARMRDVLADPEEARRLGEAAREHARERFGIERFAADWERAYADVIG